MRGSQLGAPTGDTNQMSFQGQRGLWGNPAETAEVAVGEVKSSSPPGVWVRTFSEIFLLRCSQEVC